MKPSLDDHYIGIVESRKTKADPLIEWGDAYPFLEMLMCPFDPEGKERQGMTVLMSVKHGRLHVKLNDNDADLFAWVDIPDPLRVFEEIERQLNERQLSWEPIPQKYRRRNGT